MIKRILGWTAFGLLFILAFVAVIITGAPHYSDPTPLQHQAYEQSLPLLTAGGVLLIGAFVAFAFWLGNRS
jgi:hypothetical protein